MALSRILDRGRERAWFYRAVEAVDSRGNRVLRPQRMSDVKKPQPFTQGAAYLLFFC